MRKYQETDVIDHHSKLRQHQLGQSKIKASVTIQYFFEGVGSEKNLEEILEVPLRKAQTYDINWVDGRSGKDYA